jgi:hypothetical protein
VFVSQGFNTWKKCTGELPKNNKLLKHKTSEAHVNNACKYKAYLESKLSGQTIADHISEGHRLIVEKNRQYIKTIADTLRLTAVQNIAQRGHREGDTTGNKGNFLEILNFLRSYSESLDERMSNTPQNAKYMHHVVQDAILDIVQ